VQRLAWPHRLTFDARDLMPEQVRKSSTLGLLVLLCFCLVYAHQRVFEAPTALSRLDLLHALSVRRTLCIDAYEQNTPDKAVFNGKHYSDKAPGTVALALGPFALATGVVNAARIGLESGPGWLFTSWAACAASIGLITACGGGALFAWLSARVPPRSALITTLALFLGAAPLPYATMMFSHSLVVGLVSIVIWAVDRQGRSNSEQAASGLVDWSEPHRWDLLAGFSAGWALASEYTAGIVLAGILLWLGIQDWRRAVRFCLAGALPLLLIPGYSWACFGDPFTLPYSHQASFTEMKRGLYAIEWPNAQTALNLLFSPARGLFFWSPFLAIASLGYAKLYRVSPRLFWLTYAAPLLQIIVISGRTWDWPAGPAWGPRLLSPMLPLLALPCAFAVGSFPRIGALLAIYSIVVTTLATLTNACPPFNSHPNPLLDFNIPLLARGDLCPNLGILLGLPPLMSLLLFYGILIGGAWWIWQGLPKAGEPALAATGAQSRAAPEKKVLSL
jgi:hypothetical protein